MISSRRIGPTTVIIDDPVVPRNPFPEDSHLGKMWRRQENARVWAKLKPWYEGTLGRYPLLAEQYLQQPIIRELSS